MDFKLVHVGTIMWNYFYFLFICISETQFIIICLKGNYLNCTFGICLLRVYLHCLNNTSRKWRSQLIWIAAIPLVVECYGLFVIRR